MPSDVSSLLRGLGCLFQKGLGHRNGPALPGASNGETHLGIFLHMPGAINGTRRGCREAPPQYCTAYSRAPGCLHVPAAARVETEERQPALIGAKNCQWPLPLSI